MGIADTRHEILQALAQTKLDLRDARAILTAGDDPEKVRAAGELEWLTHQRLMLEARLAECDRNAARNKTFFSGSRQVWFDLMLQFESWIAHG
ncbi:MAG TPA: hypothetical protein VMT68_03495 [Caulobacteraceae bacterium]|nr:hypothetical protein [Caulobacteraceae bacterium]